jgi:hypothetical protein
MKKKILIYFFQKKSFEIFPIRIKPKQNRFEEMIPYSNFKEQCFRKSASELPYNDFSKYQ